MIETHTTIAILVAGGRGTRANTAGPKQWEPMAGYRVADWTAKAFSDHPSVDHIIVVHHPDDAKQAFAIKNVTDFCTGGETRAESVKNGLERAKDLKASRILIHDMARPCVSHQVISNCLNALDHSLASAPGLIVADALWRGHDGKVVQPVERTDLYRAQTPQCFAFDAIYKAHQTAPTSAKDDVEVAIAAGISVSIVEGDEDNLKITYPADFVRAQNILEKR